MKSKTFLILLVICAALAVTSWFLLQQGSSPGPQKTEKAGTHLLTQLPVKEIGRIDITGPKGNVVLAKGKERWTVKNRFGFPADFPKLSEFVLKLRDMKIIRTFPASDEILTRLSLHPPDASAKSEKEDGKGTRVTLKGAKGVTLSDIIIGKPRESDAGQGGNYVMPVGESTIYVVNERFDLLDTAAGRWIRKQLLDVPSEKIARIERLDRIASDDPGAAAEKKPAYSIVRSEKDKPSLLTDVPEGLKILPEKVNRVMDALSAFRIEDVADPRTPAEKTGLENGPCFRYTLVDGTVYTLCKGKTVENNPDQTYLTVNVAFHPPPAVDGKAADSGEAEPAKASAADAKAPESPGVKPEESADPAITAAEQDKKLSPWIFTIPQWKADQLIVDKAEFLEAPAANDSPAEKKE